MNISIVTPWHEHPELLPDYLEAVSERRDTDELLIVDSAEVGNLGFCGGCNYGLARAGCDAVLFLNNDIVLRRRGWLDEIRALIEPGVLVGPLRHGRHADVDGQQLPYLDGWCLAGTREDLLSLGGFDEGLEEPAYFSDNLLCLEARAAGMSLVACSPGIQHLENVTAGSAWEPAVAAATSVNKARYQARARELLVAS